MWLQVDMEADLDMLASLALMQARQAARPPATHQLKATVHTGSAGAFVPPLVAECTEQYTCSNTCNTSLAGLLQTWQAPCAGFGGRGQVSNDFGPTLSQSSVHATLWSEGHVLCPTFSKSLVHATALAGVAKTAAAASKRLDDAEAKYSAAVARVAPRLDIRWDVLGREDHCAASRKCKSALEPCSVYARPSAFVPCSAKAHTAQVARALCSEKRRNEDGASRDSSQDTEKDIPADGAEGFSLEQYCAKHMKIDAKTLKKGALVRILNLAQLFRTLHSKVQSTIACTKLRCLCGPEPLAGFEFCSL